MRPASLGRQPPSGFQRCPQVEIPSGNWIDSSLKGRISQRFADLAEVTEKVLRDPLAVKFAKIARHVQKSDKQDHCHRDHPRLSLPSLPLAPPPFPLLKKQSDGNRARRWYSEEGYFPKTPWRPDVPVKRQFLEQQKSGNKVIDQDRGASP